MTLPRPTIVIFDMDGTSVRHLNPRLLHILEWLDDISFKIARLFTWIFERKGHGPMELDGESLEPKKKPKLLVHRALHKVRRKSVEQIVEPCPGIYAVLTLLQSCEIPVALVSNGLGKGYGHDILQKFGLERYFRTTIFREDIKKSKPHPEPLLLALTRLGIKVDGEDVIWYVGDRHKDVIAAQRADERIAGTVVPVAYGLNAALAVLEKGISPDHIIMSYFDMYSRLKKLLENMETPKKTAEL